MLSILRLSILNQRACTHRGSDVSKRYMAQCTHGLRPAAAAQDAGKKQVMAMMGIQTTRASTVARPFMRLLPQKLTVQVPGSDTESEVSARNQSHRCDACSVRKIRQRNSSKFTITITMRPVQASRSSDRVRTP